MILELEGMLTFMELLYSIRMKRNVEDKLYKRPTKSSLFEVKSFIEFLLMEVSSLFPGRVYGASKFHSRLPFFTWTAVMGRILTMDDLCWHKVCVIEWCYMRKKVRKIFYHLFIHCDYASELWSLVFYLFRV